VTATKARKRVRVRARRKASAPDGALRAAQSRLADAVAALVDPRPQHLDGHTVWLDSRWVELCEALDGPRGGRGGAQPSSVVPFWLDALLLTMRIDARTAELDAAPDTPTRLRSVLERHRRPHDTKTIETITGDLQAFVKAIDDLFSPKPIYLPDPCPHCGHDYAYLHSDDGQRIRRPALAVTAEHGAVCNHCHDAWAPDQLIFLGRILGYRQPQGVTL
jgi:hypothetical protein